MKSCNRQFGELFYQDGDKNRLETRYYWQAMIIWFQFAICAAVILFSGSRLSHCGELIAEKGGLSKSLVGLLLLAAIASSSQLATSVSSVVLHDLPDLAVSGLMGSCMFNMMVIGLLDFFSGDRPLSNRVHRGHVLTAGFGIVLIGFAAVDMMYNKYLPIVKIMNSMDPITLSFIPVYLLAMSLTFKFEKSRVLKLAANAPIEVSDDNGQSWTKLIASFIIYSVLIVSTSCYLPTLAENIQAMTGWGESFIGSSFIAITTCLPEMAVALSAAKRGSFDMAVASLLGSTLCYMVILAITDFCYVKEPILRHVSEASNLTAVTAMISMGIVIIALTYRADKKLLFMAVDAVALILVYLLANTLLFIAH